MVQQTTRNTYGIKPVVIARRTSPDSRYENIRFGRQPMEQIITAYRGYITRDDIIHVIYRRRDYMINDPMIKRMRLIGTLPVDAVEKPGEIVLIFEEKIDEPLGSSQAAILRLA
jgi:hypothetical protein